MKRISCRMHLRQMFYTQRSCWYLDGPFLIPTPTLPVVRRSDRLSKYSRTHTCHISNHKSLFFQTSSKAPSSPGRRFCHAPLLRCSLNPSPNRRGRCSVDASCLPVMRTDIPTSCARHEGALERAKWKCEWTRWTFIEI
jgi:hypothetical protein